QTLQLTGLAAVVANDGPAQLDGLGIGWGIVGVDRLILDAAHHGVIYAAGNGGCRVFGHYLRARVTHTRATPREDYGTLSYDAALSQFLYTAKDQTEFAFDQAGRLKTVTDPRLLTLTYTYDPSGRLTGVQAPDGGVTTFTYDTFGSSVVIIA